MDVGWKGKSESRETSFSGLLWWRQAGVTSLVASGGITMLSETYIHSSSCSSDVGYGSIVYPCKAQGNLARLHPTSENSRVAFLPVHIARGAPATSVGVEEKDDAAAVVDHLRFFSNLQFSLEVRRACVADVLRAWLALGDVQPGNV